MQNAEAAADFEQLVDLASARLGGVVLIANDDFFAEKENLVKDEAPVWIADRYTDRGKWMDGWESRRRRSPGHDWCVVRLGMPGIVRGVVVDTAFFRGNYPEACWLEGAVAPADADPLLLAADHAAWFPLLPRVPLAGDTKNRFALDAPWRVTHLRFHIDPDGGVARLRVHGEVLPDPAALTAFPDGALDLAALEHGAAVIGASDMFFGGRHHLILPGDSRGMHDGWETRRRRGPGHDWAIVRLAARGMIERVVVDTSHFKGNAPARASVEGIHAPGVGASKLAQLSGWRTLISTALQAHTRHTFDDELRRVGPVTHLRLSVYPCGGVARLRAWGVLAPEAVGGLTKLNAMTADEARTALRRTNGSSTWADAMTAARPFEDLPALLRTAERTWWSLGEADHREAFAAHPKIGEAKVPATGDAAWSTDEQSTAATAAGKTLAELAEANRQYDAKHGFLFIVCASGRSADAMLAELRARLGNTAADELRTAAEEQMKITRLRLAKLIGELG